jgi:hypothetical protein
LILGSTSSEDLYYSKEADKDTLAQAMLTNWEDHGSLVGEDESWQLLRELDENFIFADGLEDYDSYKGREFRILVIKIGDRYFAYHYTNSSFDSDCYSWEEVKPIPVNSYKLKYVPIDSPLICDCEITEDYIKLYEVN